MLIRGVLIKHGTRLKRERTTQLSALLDSLHRLEARYKHAPTLALSEALSVTRKQILDLLLFRAKVSLQHCRKVFFARRQVC